MPIKPTEKIWHNGKLINWEDAKIHVLSHVVSYASAVFEGLRCYDTKNGPAIFRVREHMQRMVNSGKIYRLELPFTADELSNAAAEVVRVNKMNSCYIRPIALRGYGEIGVGGTNVPTEIYIACWEWGRYPEAIEQGVDVCVSSWNRMAPNTLPSMAKAAANYMNSQLIHMEAHANGYSEGIALDVNGCVSEGSGENIFVAMDGVLLTPPIGSSVLPGITRNSVITLCEDLKIPVREQMIPREMLYIADEVFFTGTAAEISPLRSIDRIKVGKGSRGPITKALQEEFFALLTGAKADRHGWLTPVSVPMSAVK
jgi:branched-chain amino acid aminotransferase